jgi:hypothetical protein
MSGTALDSYNTYGELLRHLCRSVRLTRTEPGIALGTGGESP